MSTQKPPRDPSITTQLDGHEPPAAPPKLKPAKKSKKPGAVFGLPKS